MGLFRSVLLVGAGAAVGYFASKRANASAEKKTGALVQYQQGTLALNPESQMGKFFDSPVGKPLQPYALKAVEFAARVREKEAELHAKVERQKQDIRPGSIDTWDRQMSEQEIASTNRAAAERELLDVESRIAATEEELRAARIQRDRELGEDFFN